MKALDGKAVVVTGSGHGIGAAYAKAVAKRGAAVVINGQDAQAARDVAKDINDAGGRAVAHPADIAKWSEAAGLIQRCISEFGAIDGLVNNAGHYSIGRLDELGEHDIRKAIDVNLIGTINCAAHAVRPMVAHGKGSIINVTSGSQMGVPTMGVHSATKGAVASITYTWALELKDKGVRVNAISPLGATRMHELRDAYLRARGLPPLQTPQTPPENNAPVVEFLLSDASAAVTGQVVRIDGPQLTLCTHPGILLPILHDEHWTFESVCKAFEQDLAKRQVPLGIVGMDVTFTPNPSNFWSRVGESR
ncbi:MAG: SDR family oxidoreductase [Rhodospirillaceae bacterium]|nr:MAG: SDR family oxidoreductase [Rhodospirillaceae bacterium]